MKEKVGSELEKLIPAWAVINKSNCSCSDMAKKLNRHGIVWCEDNKDTIVAHLMSQSEHLIPAFKLVPAAMKKIVAEQLVNKAIENARKAT
jgi:predicted nucleic acid-binding Zn finger protein